MHRSVQAEAFDVDEQWLLRCSLARRGTAQGQFRCNSGSGKVRTQLASAEIESATTPLNGTGSYTHSSPTVMT